MPSFELAVSVTLIAIFLTRLIYKWRNPKSNGILPPGSMGLPLIGETLELIIPSYSLDVPPFIKKRLKRYGPVFRTSVAGRPVVVSADPEFNHFILQQEGKLVESWYLDLFAKVFNQGVNRPDGAILHKYMRNAALSHFGPESLKTKLLSQLEEFVHKTLINWSNQPSVEVKHAASIMALEFGAKKLFSVNCGKSLRELSDKYTNISKGLMSFPVNVPGTAYNKCLKDHKKVLDMIEDVLKERLSSPEISYGDMLDHLIQDMDVESFLTEKFIVQLLFSLLFVTFDSISTTLALAFKLLADNPQVLDELTAEHEALLKKRENPDSPITWEEYKSMTFTLHVINETLRLGSVSPGFLRKARNDIQVNGYTIPGGWAVMLLNSALQMDPTTFENPLEFNPSRWKELKGGAAVSKYFTPFGGGLKQCAGAEYTRVLLSLFFHVLVTKYRWTKIDGGDVVRTPILRFRNGVRVKITNAS